MSTVHTENAGHALDPAVAAVPDGTALVVAGDRSWTYAELEQQVRSVAAALADRGVGPGDRVALVDNAGVLSLATILACARLGAASAQMNVELTPGELSQLAATVGARVGVAGDPFRPRLGEALGPDAVLGMSELLSAPPDAPALDAVDVEPGDTALVLFTSGTTGLPKPIPISHGVVAERLGFYGTPIDPDGPQDVDLLSVPIFHIGGTLGVLVSFRRGHRVVALPRFDAVAWLRAVEEHGAANTFLVPTMLQRILDHPDFGARDVSSQIGRAHV